MRILILAIGAGLLTAGFAFAKEKKLGSKSADYFVRPVRTSLVKP